MASYALPASAITHSHHGHGHVRSHSHSRSRPSSLSDSPSKTLRQERSNGILPHTHEENGHAHCHNHEVSAHPPAYNGSAYMANQAQEVSFSPKIDYYDPPSNESEIIHHSHDHSHDHEHKHHVHSHSHSRKPEPRSKVTNFLLPMVRNHPLLHTILSEKDSRRIFYFMSLNFAFMVVQAFYGFVTDSLGLLSDSIHMFFDCLALAVGLFAAVASNWPPSERFPYGFGKIESLSGFGNGVFLILISIEIMIEAVERLAEGRETKRLGELFIVSTLGLIVNLVGMACFGHHHHGHDHGSHNHGHSHDHAHTHEDRDHDHKHSPLLSDGGATPKPHSHSHSHENENMRGIFLHVLADTMGSAAVIVSTLLIRYVGWSGWDPLASCIIAILIFISSIPLVKSCAEKLLITIPDDVEYTLRDTIGGVANLRGVDCVCVPRFWMGDKNAETESEQVLGVMHIVATRGSDLDDVRERTRAFLRDHGMDIVVQVEMHGDVSCWCGGNTSRSSSSRCS